MKISKKSWHYKLNSSLMGFSPFPKTLCSYVLTTCMHIIILMCIFSLLSCLLFFAISIPILLGYATLNNVFPTLENHWYNFFIVGLLEVLIITFIGFYISKLCRSLKFNIFCKNIEYVEENKHEDI